MSSLITSNISDGTTSVPTGYVVNGSAKAWASFNGGVAPSVKDSLNISSISDLGTGDYRLNLTSALASTSAPALAGQFSGPQLINPIYMESVSLIRVQGFTGGASTDFVNGSAMAQGDLA